MMKNYEDFSTTVTTVTLSDESYSALLLKVAEYYRVQKEGLEVLTSSFVSDRFSKKVYYFAVLKRGNNQINDVTPFLDDEDGE